MTITCANCGTQNAEGNAFCENCGQALATAPPPVPGSVPPAADVAPTTVSPLPGAAVPPAADSAPTTVSPLPGAAGIPPVTLPPGGVQPAPPPYGAAPGGVPPYGAAPGGPPPYGAAPGGAPPYGGGYGAVPPGGAPPYPPYGGGGVQPPGPRHRLPMFAIVGAVIGALILLALGAVVVHALASTTNPTPTPVINPTATPVTSPSPAPVTTPTAQVSATSGPTGTPSAQPTPGQTGTPAPQPSGTVTPPPPNGVTVETNTWKATLPSSDWKVTNQKNASAELDDPNGDGFIYINAGTQSPPASTSQIIQSLIAQISQQNQGVKECDNGQQQAAIGAPPVTGTTFALCYAANDQNGQATQVVDAFWIGTTNSGGNIYSLEIFGPASSFNQLGNDVTPIIKSIQWKV